MFTTKVSLCHIFTKDRHMFSMTSIMCKENTLHGERNFWSLSLVSVFSPLNDTNYGRRHKPD